MPLPHSDSPSVLFYLMGVWWAHRTQWWDKSLQWSFHAKEAHNSLKTTAATRQKLAEDPRKHRGLSTRWTTTQSQNLQNQIHKFLWHWFVFLFCTLIIIAKPHCLTIALVYLDVPENSGPSVQPGLGPSVVFERTSFDSCMKKWVVKQTYPEWKFWWLILYKQRTQKEIN